MKILCLGDSISAGIGGTSGNSYPDIMCRKLKKKGIKAEVINNGRPGDSTRDFYEFLELSSNTVSNFSKLIPWFKPQLCYDLIILMLGTNDCRTDNWVESEDSIGFLSKTIDLITSWVKSRKHIIICTIIPLADPMPKKIVGGAHNWKQDKIEEELNPGIKVLANKKRVSYFDVHTQFQEEIDSGMDLYDGIHPYNNGYRFIGNLIAEYIVKRFPDTI